MLQQWLQWPAKLLQQQQQGGRKQRQHLRWRKRSPLSRRSPRSPTISRESEPCVCRAGCGLVHGWKLGPRRRYA